MRFQLAHKLMTYLLAASAAATLGTSGVLGLPTLLVFVVIGALSWYFEGNSRLARALDRAGLALRLAVLAFFAFSVWRLIDSFFLKQDPDTTAVVDLVLFLLGYTLFQRRANRDYQQIYVLCFLLVLAAAALANSIAFAAGFAAFVVIGIWSLILFHLRREMEDNYLVKHSPEAPSERVEVDRILNSRRVVGAPFFLATGLVALIVLGASAGVFLIIPRIGAGFLFGNLRPGRHMAGFSDEVTLGQHGAITMDNETVALRAVLPNLTAMTDTERTRAIEGLYWRGTVYDRYIGGRWERSQSGFDTRLDVAAPRSADQGPRTFLSDPLVPNNETRRSRIARSVRQEIDLVGINHPIAFALDQPVAFEIHGLKPGATMMMDFEARWDGEVGIRVRRIFTRSGIPQAVREFSGARYVAYSRNPQTGGPRTGRPIEEIDKALLAPYLQVPDSLTRRVRELADSVAGGKPNAAAKAAAVLERLQKDYRYTTDLKRDPTVADPLEDFLFHQRAGHCEYFASAAAILLRLSGVPTRYVNGFLGGEWNDLAQLVTVRDNRAHSWVEAYLGAFGWVRIDATPSGRGIARMNPLRQLLDSIELLWARWVMDYDLARQAELVRNLRRIAGPTRAQARRPDGKFTFPDRRTIAAILGAAAGLYLALRAYRVIKAGRGAASGRQTPALDAPIARLYRRCLERLSRRGWPRRSSETPRELARRLVKEPLKGVEAFERLAELYAAARFGGRPVDTDVVDDLARRLADVGAPLPPPAEAPARSAD